MANYTIINGQIYTPGLAIIDSPQPFTPEGGDSLQVAIDVSGDGKLPLPPYSPNVETGLFNITLFLTSYTTGLNLTISNGTTAGWLDSSAEPPEFGCNDSSSPDFQNAGCQEVMLQESGSTVKHVNWVWPDCLVGDGGANDGNCGNSGGSINSCLEGTARGPYNISIHQSFRINGTQYYTTIDLPIDVTNSISDTTQHSSSNARPSCALRNNPLLSPAQISSSITSLPFQPFLDGNIGVLGAGSNSGSSSGSSSSSDSDSNSGSGSSPGSGSGTSTSSISTSTQSPATVAITSIPAAAHPGGGLSSRNFAIVLGFALGALALGLLSLVFVLCRRCRRRVKIGPPRLLSRDAEEIDSWRNHKRRLGSRDGLALNPPG